MRIKTKFHDYWDIYQVCKLLVGFFILPMKYITFKIHSSLEISILDISYS